MMESAIEEAARQQRSNASPTAAASALLIDIPTLKKLLNKTSCEFILGLI